MLLDTNIVIALMNDVPEVIERAKREPEIYIPIIVLGELYFGAENSQHPVENKIRLDSFVKAIPILPCDRSTALLYGSVRKGLRVKGRPIPENDLWIAAIALQHDLPLVTRDAHFQNVERLRTIAW